MTIGEVQRRLKTVAPLAAALETSSDEFSTWMAMLGRFGSEFLHGLKEAPAFFAERHPPQFNDPIPLHPAPLEALLQRLSVDLLQSGVQSASGRFFGYVPGGGLLTASMGDFLAALTNKYSGSFGAAPGAAEIENQVVRWLLELTGFPATGWGTLQSGGSLATLTALVTARQTRQAAEWAKGVIYFTSQVHHAVTKALRIAGMEGVACREIPVDSEYRLSLPDFQRQLAADRVSGLHPWILCATAGTTNSGVVDPLSELGALCRAEKIWFHIDAAYGGFFRLTETGKQLLSGMEQADSLVLDPHKGLFQPYGLGAVLVRDKEKLRQAFAFSSDYLADLNDPLSLSPSEYSPELTRHFRGLRLWLSLQLHGVERFRAALEEKLLLAQYAHARLRTMGDLQVGPVPALSCVVFRLPTDKATGRLLDRVLAQGRVHLSSTRLGNEMYLRLCILSFRSHLADVEIALREIESATEAVLH